VRIKLLTTVCLAIAALVPASASATTVRLGPTLLGSEGGNVLCEGPSSCVAETLLQRTLPVPSVTLAAPADGTVTFWSALGKGTLKLRVLRPVGESVIAEGTSAVATDLNGGSNATNLPIKAGDVVGVDLVRPSALMYVTVEGASRSKFEPPVPEDGLADAPTATFNNDELLYNATVVLAPSVGGLLPTSGSTTGGEAIKIVGSNLDGATGVSFGSKPAAFTVD